MSKFEHRGYEIQMEEALGFREESYTRLDGTIDTNGRDYTAQGEGLIYRATSDLGVNLATKPQQVLDDAKDLIDRVLEEGI